MIPSTTSELAEWLNLIYPERCIQKNETENDAHRYAGKRELIHFIFHKLEEAEEDGITSLMESSK